MDDAVKYPRTLHLPWSLGITKDDKVLKSVKSFVGKYIVATEKRDGENTTIRPDRAHARSVDSGYHPSRSYVNQLQRAISADIPPGWRVCGENLRAQHSIPYTALTSFFEGFSVWNEHNVCLSWSDTLEFFELLGIVPVPVLYEGLFDEEKIRALANTLDLSKQEGYVIRLASAFEYNDFGTSVAKFVRRNHVQTSDHWMHTKFIPNQLLSV